MDKTSVIEKALAVRQGQATIASLPADEQGHVRAALRSMTAAQLGRLAGARERRKPAARMSPSRSLHDRAQAR